MGKTNESMVWVSNETKRKLNRVKSVLELKTQNDAIEALYNIARMVKPSELKVEEIIERMDKKLEAPLELKEEIEVDAFVEEQDGINK